MALTSTHFKEKMLEKSLLFIATSAISILILITFFIFKEGFPLFLKKGFFSMVFGTEWSPIEGEFGLLPFIVGSIWVTIGALILGVPLALACSIFLIEFAPKKLRVWVKPAIELLAGIPSVVYGFIGVVILIPFIRIQFGGTGFSVLASSVVLAIMILPTVIGISMDALSAVPYSYREGSLALGATPWQTVYRVVLPAARSGVLAGIILGMGRAIGETMAVIMVAGNSVQMPGSVLSSVRTLTSNIALEMGYAIGDHRMALFATGIILFGFIMVLNISANLLSRKRKG